MSNHETNVIGGLCYDETSDATWLCCQQNGITSEHFTEPKAIQIYEAISLLKAGQRIVNPYTVTEAAKANRLDVAWSDVREAIDNCITVQTHIDDSVQAVKTAWIQRQARNKMVIACEEMKATSDPVACIQKLQGELTMLQTQSNRFCKINHITSFRSEKVENWKRAVGQGFIGIPSTIPDLNRYLGGYRRKVMTVCGGYRGEGKSTFARQEAHGIAKHGYKALIVSLEDPEDIAQASIAGNEASVSVFNLDTGSGWEGNIDQIDEAWGKMERLPLWTASANTIDEIVSLATIQKARHGLDFLVIDHLQYINPYTLPRMDRNGTMATYSQKICTLAKQLDIAILALSQFSRDSEKNCRKPRLSDLRDSGTIEQDARAVLLLYFDSDKQHHILEVAKNNNGASKKEIPIRRIDGKQRFEVVQCQHV